MGRGRRSAPASAVSVLFRSRGAGPVSAICGLAFPAGCNAHGASGSAALAMHLVESLAGDPSPYV
jgi:hypothetical protein